jgi:hypothetical protein
LRLQRVTHPQELNHGVDERKPATLGSLARMSIRKALTKTERNKSFRYGCACVGEEKNVIELESHPLPPYISDFGCPSDHRGFCRDSLNS